MYTPFQETVYNYHLVVETYILTVHVALQEQLK